MSSYHDFDLGNFVRLGFQANPNLLKDELSEENMTQLWNKPIPNKFSGMTANSCQCIINLSKKTDNIDMIKRMRLTRNILLNESIGSQPMTCIICEEKQGNTIFTPCNHMCMCVECYWDIKPKVCIICKTDINLVIQDHHIVEKYRIV